jgi:transcription elongation factor GreA
MRRFFTSGALMRLTAQAHARLTEQLAHLREVALPEARALIDDARTAGDISQNPDYFLAAEVEGNVLAQIHRVETALAAHAAADDVELALDKVAPGVVVVLDFAGEIEEFYVGPIEEAAGGVDVVTPESPIGSALMGKAAGATVQVNGSKITLVTIKPPSY